MNEEWTRIPIPVEVEADRRQLAAILASAGLEVRIVKARLTPNGTPKRFVEYRKGG